MNPLLSNIIISAAKKTVGAREKKDSKSSYARARRMQRNRRTRVNIALDIVLLIAGILSAGFGLKGFLIPNEFIDGGATGISLLLAIKTPLSLSLLLILVNVPFIVLG